MTKTSNLNKQLITGFMKRILLSIFAITSLSVQAQIPTQNLVASYTFNSGNTGDMSGNNNDGVGAGIASTNDRFGNPDKAFYFNGTNGSITLPSGLLNIQDITISMWIKTAINDGGIFGHQNQAVGFTPSQYVPFLYMRSDSTLNASFWQGSPENICTSTTPINDNQWHHIVISSNANDQHLYIDNIEVGSGSAYSILAGMTHSQIGAGYVAGTWPGQSVTPGWRYFDGVIDDVNIYNDKLNAAQIDSLYTDANPTLNVLSKELDWSTELYPNPASGIVKIKSNLTIDSISIRNALGQTVVIAENNPFLNISHLKNGVYFVTIKSGEFVRTQKLIKK